MDISEAIALAEKWTHDMPRERPLDKMPLFNALKTLLDHTRQQSKDIEELTLAVRVLFRRNRELEDELRRGGKTGQGLDKSK